jgi:Undecaprenyl-phosphate galactose phosphotransferase WbaP
MSSSPTTAVALKEAPSAPGTPEARRLDVALQASGTRPWVSRLVLIGSDLLTLGLAAIAGVLIRHWQEPAVIDIQVYLHLWPAALLFVLGYAIERMYTVVGSNPADELRRATLATTLVYLGIAAATFMMRGGEYYSRGIFVIAWLLSLVAVPLGRALVRRLFAPLSWWGYPVVILGAGKTGEMIVKTLRRQPELGLKPIAVLDDDPSKHGSLLNVPVPGGLSLAANLAQRNGVSYAIVAMPGVPHVRLLEIVESYAYTFSHLIVIPDLFGFASLRVPVQDLGGTLGLEVRQQLLLPVPRFTKRAMDLLVTLIGGCMILPLLALLAIAVRLTSRGPILFSQQRPGKLGTPFRIWKFRTMHVDAEERFKRLTPELREEFTRFGKIKNDPRVTWVGKWMRKFSLDELPQLWNVLIGELSLVGPRPYLHDQVPDMKDFDDVVFKVVPGLTGLWQVSGRSELTFEERLKLDAYYVRNWSIWLDIWIMARTLPVLLGKGAY